MNNWRRYEILLPLRFNDGKPVAKALLAATVLELEARLRGGEFRNANYSRALAWWWKGFRR